MALCKRDDDVRVQRAFRALARPGSGCASPESNSALPAGVGGTSKLRYNGHDGEQRDRRRNASQVSLKTVFTVCFGVLAVAALVVFLLRTQVALTLALGAGMIAVAMNHGVEALTRRGLRRNWAVLAVVFGLLALGTGLSLLLVPPVISQAKALIAEAPTLWMKLRQTRLFLALDARFDLSGQLKQSVPAAAGAVAPVLVAIGGALSAVGGLVTLLLLAIFMLLFGRELLARRDRGNSRRATAASTSGSWRRFTGRSAATSPA